MNEKPLVPKADRPVPEEDRTQAVVDLRTAGYSYQEIGDRLGISKQQAHRIFKKISGKGLAVARRTLGEEYFRLSVDRLETLFRAHYEDAVIEGNRSSAELLLKIHDRLASLLGLNAPVRMAHEIEDMTSDAELRQEAERMGLDVPDDSIPDAEIVAITHLDEEVDNV